ncbi:MAG: hypothetical protein ACI9VR_002557 [Cognaticolwellia sp.]
MLWLVLSLVLLASYGPLVQAPYVWDDIPLVLNNTMTGDWSNLPRFFQIDLWQSAAESDVDSGYYRPLVLVSFAVDRSLFGDWAGGAHLHSLAWHLAAVVFLWLLLRRWVSELAAWLGAGLFALHPVQSEAVSWVAARNDLMVTAFAVATLLLLGARKPKLGSLLGGGALMFCALLSKESGVLIPIFLTALILAEHRRLPSPTVLLAALLPVAIWVAMRFSADIQGSSVPDADQFALLLSNLPAILGHYSLKLLWPAPLNVGVTMEYLDSQRAWGLLPLLVGLVIALWRGRWMAACGLLIAGLSLAPAVVAIGVRDQLGERYLYMPMVGVALAFAVSLPDTLPKSALLFAGLPLLGVHLLLVPQRSLDWRGEDALWSAAVAADPNGFALASLGHIANRQGETDRAAGLFRAALEVEPANHRACTHAVKVGLRTGRLDLAAQGAEVVGRRCAPTSEILGLVGLARLQTGDLEGTRRALALWDGGLDARMPLVAGSVAKLDGDQTAYALQRAQVPDPVSFDAQVGQLLLLSGAWPQDKP